MYLTNCGVVDVKVYPIDVSGANQLPLKLLVVNS